MNPRKARHPVGPSFGAVFAALVCGACCAPAAGNASAAPATLPAQAIYRQGWNDFNKNGRKDVYEDPSQPIEKRVEDLLGQMTLEEKIGQLWLGKWDAKEMGKFEEALRKGDMGLVLGYSSRVYGKEDGDFPASAKERNLAQRWAVEGSRLGIPVAFGYDTIHGYRTTFPIPLAQACSWDPALVERMGAVEASESAAVGIDWVFAPMVDLSRDPRWGRIAEGFGEDPYLGAAFAAAAVRGFQGRNVADPDRVIACLKHYVGYGAPERGLEYCKAEITEFTLRNFYLPAFHAGVEAGALTLMSAYNTNGGTASTANRHTLTEILRGEWGFNGFVTSDSHGVLNLIKQGLASNPAEAARMALDAGVDVEMASDSYHNTLAAQVRSGKVTQATVDEAVRDVLRVKFKKGLFERPYIDPERAQTAFVRPEAMRLAREAAARCCVLLKNDKNTLPLPAQTCRVALVGPWVKDPSEQLGCWPGPGRWGSPKGNYEDSVSLEQGIAAKLPRGRLATVVVDSKMNGLDEAIKAARAADVVVLTTGETRHSTGEGKSRVDLGLSPDQKKLFEAMVATGKPVVALLSGGRPLVITELQDNASAVLETWNAGTQAGAGVADILFGDVNPSGKLAVTFPRSVGQIPLYYNHLVPLNESSIRYLDGSGEALYPFGFGLSYTAFEYSDPKLSAATVKKGQPLQASVTVKNTGNRDGEEVVQLYIRDVAASAGARPVRELKGFQKILLKKGESREVTFNLTGKELGYYDSAGHWLVEPGKFQVWVASSSAAGTPAGFELAE